MTWLYQACRGEVILWAHREAPDLETAARYIRRIWRNLEPYTLIYIRTDPPTYDPARWGDYKSGTWGYYRVLSDGGIIRVL